jgi:hypothetical protein
MPLPNDDNGTLLPFVIGGDEVFALSQYVLRPYPSRNLDIARRIHKDYLKQEEWWNVRLS